MPKIKRGKIVTVTSMKGGVGKTTTVLQLASVFEALKKKILIVDLDFYSGDIAFALGTEANKTVFNLTDDIANNRFDLETYENYVDTYNEYIDVLASPKDPRQASKIEGKYIETILSNVTSKYDVILIDTNHVLDISNMVAFELSDNIISILTNDAFDIKSTKSFVSICKNMEVDNLILVLNKAIDSRKKSFSEVDIKNVIKKDVDYTIPTSFYLKDFDTSILDGETMKKCSKIRKCGKEYKKFVSFAEEILSDKEASADEEN